MYYDIMRYILKIVTYKPGVPAGDEDQLDTPADQQIRRRTATARLSDPRSPATCGVERTPIVATAECDVHRDWSTG